MSIVMGCAGGFYLTCQNLTLERIFFGVAFPVVMRKTHILAILMLQGVLAPVFEELVFRGVFDYLLRTYTQFNTAQRILVVASVFALCHYSCGTLGKLVLAKAFCSGLALGVLREACGLSSSIVAHSVHNLIMGIFF